MTIEALQSKANWHGIAWLNARARGDWAEMVVQKLAQEACRAAITGELSLEARAK